MNKLDKATFGGGCFWCVEAVIQRLKGIHEVVSGYGAGDTKSPTYRQICTGTTGHAEIIQVTFDPEIISFKQLLIVFMTSHDPTTLNRQGADKGTQYRSIILYHNNIQKTIAQEVIVEVQSYYKEPIVTELAANEVFYPAESNHQDYYNRNGFAGYCQIVIDPKINKLKKEYGALLKSE